MMRRVAMIGLTVVLMCPEHGVAAGASDVPPAPGVMLPPPPAPPPLPTIVPIVPNAPPQAPKANLQPNGTQGERFERCLGQATARGVNPGDRANYAGGCANN
jgi:hypothetical protein